jgi:hypothetical protein
MPWLNPFCEPPVSLLNFTFPKNTKTSGKIKTEY